ncbi:uracil-DNA glycosylase [Methylomarinum sp. Ch1-1]|uniref:Type-4 uracil-DNA glycosylase n=1 Tax=Methylomarinum roseum TaxID=3067653 RepID=A0AAU7P079_9GAMM|nr:uracil-DNA glycosylase [Methylomarinum sp. Ch1-1]MDP4521638.1 uracil-DNA glycosylase [Methylomarinum sp. Ch1-1]
MASDSEIDEATRLQYLQAMGIDVWALRRNQALPNASEESDDVEPSEAVNDDNWGDLERQVAECRLCPLSETRTQTVFGSGNKQADWMLIGEAPGQNEDREGLPFVGKAGQLLTEMIRALGMAREQVYIANVIKCRPPGNRDPKVEEVSACSDYLRRQIALIRPKIILAVGRVAAQSLLNTQDPLAKLRNVVHKLDDIPLIVIYHPAYLLRSPLEKRKAWEDLQFAMKTFEDMNK